MRVSLKPAKRPFNIDAVLRRIRQEVKQFADAAMFGLAEQGYVTPFQIDSRVLQLDLLPAIFARLSPLKRKLVQSSIAVAPTCL